MFPPCTERTIHFVSSDPLYVGTTHLQLLQEALRVPDMIETSGSSFNIIASDNLPVSNRDIQEANGRPVFHYDHTKYCPLLPPEPKIKFKGHYEKMKGEVSNTIFVSGNKPSGIPGAFVVPTDEVEGPKN